MTDYAGQAPARICDDMPEATGGEKSIGEALGDVTRDLSVLVQQELALAKAEVRQTATPSGPNRRHVRRRRSRRLLVRALLVARPVDGNQRQNWAWLGAVIVAVIWLVAGVVLYLVARAQMKKISGIAQTTESVRQVPNALKGHEERNQ